MKILLTGSNSRQCGTARPNPGKVFDATNLCTMLKSFADVDFMPVDNSTNFGQYDFVVSGFGAIGSFTYADTLAALQAIGSAGRPIVYLEDWKCPNAIARGLKATYDKGYDVFVEKVFNKTLSGGTKFYNNTENLNPQIVWEGIEKVIVHPQDCLFIIPGFRWGDKDIVADVLGAQHGSILWFDETPYCIEQMSIPDVPYAKERKHKFFYCGLSNQDTWLKKAGIKDLTDCFGVAPYEKIKTEKEVNAKHNEYLGIAIPEYYHGGSGWLRLRYIYGAMTKNVFAIGSKDASALGIEPVSSFSIGDVNLERIAMHTYSTIKNFIPTMQEANNMLKEQFSLL